VKTHGQQNAKVGEHETDVTAQSMQDEWKETCYREGSSACRNYSQLTMQTRTLSGQVLVLGIVGIIAALATTHAEATYHPTFLIVGGAVLIAFSFSLALVDWHYQSAFTAIRNSLVDIEKAVGVSGPWRAHVAVRTKKRDHFASYVPFFILYTCGTILAGWGITKCPRSSVLSESLIISWLAVLSLAWIYTFLRLGKVLRESARKDKEIYEAEKSPAESRSVSPPIE
jgi:hypothetical protein